MITLTIDNQTVTVPANSTILQAARQLNIEIPTLCHLNDCEPSTSCMVCVVETQTGQLLPACAAPVQPDQIISTNSPRVIDARRNALELILSEHLGDCHAPCQLTCPAQMNIPLMIRQIQQDKNETAIETVKTHIALPATLGRICPAPCEKACRRRQQDQPLSICLLKKFVADLDLAAEQPYQPPCAQPLNKSVAVIGAGPAGLAAAYYLKQAGLTVTIFDANPLPGGTLRYSIPSNQLEPQILDREISTILNLGIEFRPQTTIGTDITLDTLAQNYNAVFIAAGFSAKDYLLADLKLTSGTFQTSTLNIFAGGDIIRPHSRRLAIRSLADGRQVAPIITAYLQNQPIQPIAQPFNSRIGRLEPHELQTILQLAQPNPRIEPADSTFTQSQAQTESQRCLHCDCRKLETCQLKSLSQKYHASPRRYQSPRREYRHDLSHPKIIFEPGKCINCGICLQITRQNHEQLGLAFTNRGYDVRLAVPFDRPVSQALQNSARQCVQHCPTAALALKTPGN